MSLDLIFGVPGQTVALWQDDLNRVLALQPHHVSTYGLTYEKGTPLWKQRQQGIITPIAEESELELYRMAIDTLEAAGFEHYEISNFARLHSEPGMLPGAAGTTRFTGLTRPILAPAWARHAT